MASKKNSIIRKLHKWVGVIASLFILFYAFSGIILNHRRAFRSVDIDRSSLPKNYHYTNWNNQAVKSALQLSADSVLVYGRIGIWLSCDNFKRFQDFNAGFPNGADNRRVNCMIRTREGKLLAGTQFGLYEYLDNSSKWQKIELNPKDENIIDILNYGDSLVVMTRSNLYLSSSEKSFVRHEIPAPKGYKPKAKLFKTLWNIHSGEIFGIVGKVFVDLLGLLFVFASITGIIFFVAPSLLKRRKGKDNSQIIRVNKFSLRWHNHLGTWLFASFIVLTITGMFLRPPLLIPIARTQVGIIPYTHMDQPNPWFDKLRRICYDNENDQFLLSTSSGVFTVDRDFEKAPVRLAAQPPISLMGANVFHPLGQGNFLIGSFSGLFIWNPGQKRVVDYFTARPYARSSGRPFGRIAVTGYIKDINNKEWLFEYSRGAMPIRHETAFTSMPSKIIENSPVSFWNFCLEMHTGRLFKFLLGDFYILFIPISGLLILFVLISGLIVWWRWYRKKKKL